LLFTFRNSFPPGSEFGGLRAIAQTCTQFEMINDLFSEKL